MVPRDGASPPRARPRAWRGKISGRAKRPKLQGAVRIRGQGPSGRKYPRHTFAPVALKRSAKDGYRVPNISPIQPAVRSALPKTPRQLRENEPFLAAMLFTVFVLRNILLVIVLQKCLS